MWRAASSSSPTGSSPRRSPSHRSPSTRRRRRASQCLSPASAAGLSLVGSEMGSPKRASPRHARRISRQKVAQVVARLKQVAQAGGGDAQGKGLRAEFDKFDSDGDGSLSYDELSRG